MAAAQAAVGLWGEVSPRGFFDSFPAVFGQHWVRAFGPYDEHLVRDAAAAELGFVVLLAAAAIWLERRLVLVAGTAFLVFTAAHLGFHLTETEPLSTSANALSLGGFVLEMAIVAAVMRSVVPTTRKETIHVSTAARQAART